MNSVLPKIVDFLRGIGLRVVEREITEPTIMPGITVDHGALVIDSAKLLHPGDLLHEAGHLAVVPQTGRGELGADVGSDGGLEMGAIAWSYAACVHLGLPVEVVFHDEGYKGGASALRENFVHGKFIGAPILAWRGLTRVRGRGAGGEGTVYYPAMEKWLSD